MADWIYALDVDEYLFGMGALIFGVVWCFFASFRYLRHARLMEDIPTSRVRSAPQGYVELSGIAKLMDGPPIACPLSGIHCLWWRFTVEKHVRSNKRSYWKNIETGTSEDLFYLEDPTGRCVIDPDGARVIHSRKRVWHGHSPRPDRGPDVSSMGGSYRYTEYLVMQDDPLYALGEFRSDRGPSVREQRQQAVRDLIAQWKADPEKMKIFDVNRDGNIDTKEWRAAHKAAEAQVRRSQIGEAPSDAIHIMARPKDHGYPYILSTQDQGQLIPKWKRYSAACFAGFLAGGSMFIYAWIVRPPLGIFLS